MKKILLLTILALFSVTTTFSQTPIDIDLAVLETQFEKMGDDMASSVASSATTGLVWSDAYIGNFPHFGVGAFSGVQIMPVDAFKDVLKAVDPSASLPSQLDSYGVPIPAIGADARIGGFALPFDVGVKFSMLNGLDMADVSFDYLLVGADVRYALIKGGAVLPSVSVGVGFSHLSTDVSVGGILSGDYDLINEGPGATLVVSNPDMNYGWESNVIEFKTQVSKSFLLLTPYAGMNVAYSMTKIGGGVQTSVKDENGNVLTQAEVDSALELAKLAGYTGPTDVDVDGFEVMSNVNAWAFKVHGGTSINIAILKIDINANYDLLGKTYGGQLGFRLQF